MFAFRYIGHFDLGQPLYQQSPYTEAAPSVAEPIAREQFREIQSRFSVEKPAFKWTCGAIMSFLSLPGEYHPFERALIEEANCAALNMRMEIICAPGVVSAPLVPEVWREEDYLKGPIPNQFPWYGEFYRRLVWSEEESERMPPSLQGQLLYAATNLEYELRSGGQRWQGAEDVFQAQEEFVVAHLCDGTFATDAGSVSRRAMEGLNTAINTLVGGESCDCSQAGNDIEKVANLAYHWCRLHPLPLPPAKVMWEEPAE